jgi:hypothetical protein
VRRVLATAVAGGVTYRGTTVIVQPGARMPAALGRVIATLQAIA